MSGPLDKQTSFNTLSTAEILARFEGTKTPKTDGTRIQGITDFATDPLAQLAREARGIERGGWHADASEVKAKQVEEEATARLLRIITLNDLQRANEVIAKELKLVQDNIISKHMRRNEIKREITTLRNEEEQLLDERDSVIAELEEALDTALTIEEQIAKLEAEEQAALKAEENAQRDVMRADNPDHAKHCAELLEQKQAALAALRAKLDTVRGKFDEQKLTINELETTLAEIDESLLSVRGKIATLEDEYNANEADIAALEKREAELFEAQKNLQEPSFVQRVMDGNVTHAELLDKVPEGLRAGINKVYDRVATTVEFAADYATSAAKHAYRSLSDLWGGVAPDTSTAAPEPQDTKAISGPVSTTCAFHNSATGTPSTDSILGHALKTPNPDLKPDDPAPITM